MSIDGLRITKIKQSTDQLMTANLDFLKQDTLAVVLRLWSRSVLFKRVFYIGESISCDLSRILGRSTKKCACTYGVIYDHDYRWNHTYIYHEQERNALPTSELTFSLEMVWKSLVSNKRSQSCKLEQNWRYILIERLVWSGDWSPLTLICVKICCSCTSSSASL